MQFKRLAIVLSALTLLAAWPVPAAEGGAWAKYHAKLKGKDGGVIAEYTHITTRDPAAPTVMRTLIEDADDRLLVVRQTLDRQSGSGRVSVETADGKEQVVFSWPDKEAPTQVTVNGSSIEYAADAEGSADVVVRGSTLLREKASEEFRDALRSVASLGTFQTKLLSFPANRLKGAFFDDIRGKIQRGVEEKSAQFVESFDPQALEPDEFEKRFGEAYYQ